MDTKQFQTVYNMIFRWNHGVKKVSRIILSQKRASSTWQPGGLTQTPYSQGVQTNTVHSVVLHDSLCLMGRINQSKEDAMGIKPLEVHAKSIANELELMLKLLGGTPEERWRAIEALTGITSRAVVQLVASQMDAMTQSLKTVNTSLKTLKVNAKALSSGTQL